MGMENVSTGRTVSQNFSSHNGYKQQIRPSLEPSSRRASTTFLTIRNQEMAEPGAHTEQHCHQVGTCMRLPSSPGQAQLAQASWELLQARGRDWGQHVPIQQACFSRALWYIKPGQGSSENREESPFTFSPNIQHAAHCDLPSFKAFSHCERLHKNG